MTTGPFDVTEQIALLAEHPLHRDPARDSRQNAIDSDCEGVATVK
jgi:hypothetical protein